MANNTNPVNMSGPGQYAGGAAPSQYDQQAIGSGAQYQPGHQQGLGTGATSQGNYAQDAGATTGTQKTGIKGKIENALHGNKNTPATNTTTTSQANPTAGDGLLHSSRGQLPPDVVNAQGGAHGAALASGQNVGGAGAAGGAGYGSAQNQAGTETHHHHHHHHHDGNGNQQVGQGHGHAAGIGAGAGAAGLAGATAAHHHHEHNQHQQQQQAGYGAPGALPAGAGHTAVGAGGVGYGAGGAYDGGATNAQVPLHSHAGAGVTHPHAHNSHMPTKGEAVVGGVGAAGLAEAAHHHHEHHGHHGHGAAAGTTTGTGAHGTTTGSHLPTKGEALVGGAGAAGIGEAAHHHHEHHGHHGHGAAGTTTTGTGATGTTTGATKPSVGDKISGTIDTVVGKMTHNDQKIEEGLIKKTEGSAALPHHGNAAGTGGGYGTY